MKRECIRKYNNNIITYDSINIMKFICAILVVVIHTNPFGTVDTVSGFIVNGVICRIAVPLFFISSGYFYYMKAKNNEEYICIYLKKILNLYINWTAIYFIWDIFQLSKNGLGIKKNLILYIRDLVFVGSHLQLWYLLGLSFAIIYIHIINKTFGEKFLVISMIILFFIGLAGDSYAAIFKNSWITSIIRGYELIFKYTKNGICFSGLFVYIGIAINKYSLEEKINIKYILVFLISIIFALEAIILKIFNIPQDYNMYLSLVILAPILFVKVLKFPIAIAKNYSKLLKDLSLGIYCCHGVFIIIDSKISIIFRINDFKYINFILVIIGSIALTLIIRNSKYKLIRNLI